MVGYGHKKTYVDPDSDLKITWAQRGSTTLTCFGNCEIITTFRQKLLKQKNRQKNALEHWGKKLETQ